MKEKEFDMNAEPTVVQRFEKPKTIAGRTPRTIIVTLRELCGDIRLHPARRMLAVQLLCYCEGILPKLPKEFRQDEPKFDFRRPDTSPPLSVDEGIEERDAVKAELSEHDLRASARLLQLAKDIQAVEDEEDAPETLSPSEPAGD